MSLRGSNDAERGYYGVGRANIDIGRSNNDVGRGPRMWNHPSSNGVIVTHAQSK